MDDKQRKDWLLKRKKYLTASDVAAVLGESPYKTNLDVFLDKTTILISDEDNRHMRYGRAIEDAIAKMFEYESSMIVHDKPQDEISVHPDIPWLAATLDRRVKSYGKICPLELKNVHTFELPCDWFNDIPMHMWIQLQLQMAVENADHGILAALFHPSLECRWAEIDFDQNFFDTALPILDKFWNHNVANKIPPEPHFEHDKCIQSLKKIHPDDNGKTVIINNDAAYSAYVDAIEYIKHYTEQRKTAQAEIIHALGGSTFGILSNGDVISYKTQEKKSYTVKASKTRIMRVKKQK